MARSTLLPIAALALLVACGSDDSKTATTDTDPGAEAMVDVAFDSAVDSSLADTAAEVADTGPNPGEFGAPCDGNGDCLSGYCVEGADGYICTRQCDETCPEGFDCRSIPGRADVSFVCVPRLRKFCTPCSDDLQCGDGACLQQDGAGGCAATCGEAADCPLGFTCAADPAGRAPALYCQPNTGSCTCSATTDLGERSCSATADDAVCFGIQRCDPATGWGECSAATPMAELCNGLDDDCNGEIDDGLVAGQPCTNEVAGVGACPGTSRCTGTPGWVCDGPQPELEVCNGLDDDCDDGIDEDFRDASGAWTRDAHCGRCNNDCTTRFANGVGRCGGSAEDPRCEVDQCDEGYILLDNQCIEPVDATCQSCDGDDDCFGGSCLAFEGAATVCLMPCAPGSGACPSGLSCTTFGDVDRCAPASGSCACTPGLAGNQRTCSRENEAGRCLGVEVCQDESWSECSAATPAPEVCNGADDDCNGQLDDDPRWDNLGAPCSAGTGVCQASGVFVCDPDDPSRPSVCSASPGERGVETCNGLDDDCDGETDEGLDAPLCPLQEGVCAGARAVCAGVSGFLPCNAGSYGDDYELVELSCDQQDNDCDGATDEVDQDADGHRPLACGGDDCDDGEANAHPGLSEVCGDELDNDCDGSADNKDSDADGFVDAACGGPDCNDANAAVNPDADEMCGDQVDQDCTGGADDKDLDGDGDLDEQCAGGFDCDDADAEVLSTGAEVWDAKDNDCDGLVDEDLIPLGALVVTEIMVAPDATSDAAGEYFEVHNVSASNINLRSWEVDDGDAGGSDSFTVSADVIVAPGDSAVLCRVFEADSNGGVDCDYHYGASMDLADGADGITLSLAGQAIDGVLYDERFPVVAGRALSLDPWQHSRNGNNVHGNWCATPLDGGNQLAGGDYGTPGRGNPACSGAPQVSDVTPSDGIEHGGDTLVISGQGFIATAAVRLGGTACQSFEVIDDQQIVCTTPAHVPGDVAIEITKGPQAAIFLDRFRFTGEGVTLITWVDLQHPKALTASAGQASELVFGQVRAQGYTEPEGAPAGISGQVGFGPFGTDPRTTPGWRWFDAVWNKQFFDNDEFMASMTIPEPGTYSYAYRFTDDGGINFMYGDFDPGTADGLTIDNLGTATVN